MDDSAHEDLNEEFGDIIFAGLFRISSYERGDEENTKHERRLSGKAKK